MIDTLLAIRYAKKRTVPSIEDPNKVIPFYVIVVENNGVAVVYHSNGANNNIKDLSTALNAFPNSVVAKSNQDLLG